MEIETELETETTDLGPWQRGWIWASGGAGGTKGPDDPFLDRSQRRNGSVLRPWPGGRIWASGEAGFGPQVGPGAPKAQMTHFWTVRKEETAVF